MAKIAFTPESLQKFGDSGMSYHHGETIALIGLLPERGAASLSPLHDVGWTIPGALISATGNLVKDKLNVELGSPRVHIVSQVTKVEETVNLQFNAFRMPVGLMLANSNNLGATFTYGTPAGDIEASPTPTKKQCDVDVVTGFAEYDLAEFDLRVSSYGGFKECTFLNATPLAGAGTVGTLYYDDLPYAPASGTTVKKVDSYKQYVGGKDLFQCQLLLVTAFQNNEMLYIRHYARGEVIEGTGLDPKTNAEHATIGFTFKSKPQYQSIADYFGNTKKQPVTRVDYIVSRNAT